MDVRELDIDLIDQINPFSEAYAILAKTMSEESLKQVQAVISAKKVQLSPEEARDLARRAVKFKQERGRLPSITSADAWEKKMAEGVEFGKHYHNHLLPRDKAEQTGRRPRLFYGYRRVLSLHTSHQFDWFISCAFAGTTS